MSSNRPGHFSADIGTAEGRQAFRLKAGLNYFDRGGVHCIEAVNDQGEGFYVYLPSGIESGVYQLEIGLPSIIHVTDCAEAELYPEGTLTLAVEDEGQFTGIFSGTDANGITVRNGSFRLAFGALS